MNYPRLSLAIDNCFASKRWTKPAEWMEVIKELGLNCIEASADTECDPLYMGREYLLDWADEVKINSEKFGVKVANLYSGHGTYATLGLAHTDGRVRERFVNQWLKPMLDVSGKIGAGLGFFCHAFPDSVLQNQARYAENVDDLYNNLAVIARYAKDNGYGPAGVEQMYTPHQIPWTIQGAQELISAVYQRSGSPFYITIDVGHQSGQRKFLRPGYDEIKTMLHRFRDEGTVDWPWLGSKKATEIFQAAARLPENAEDDAIARIESDMNNYPYLFAAYEDGDPYQWLEKLGSYSPIIHLQQTTGVSSAHLPFTKEQNEKGIIFPDKIFRALLLAYQSLEAEGMPPRCQEIYLTLEMFTGTAETNRYALAKLKESVAYWRQFIPEDGMRLDQLSNIM